MAAAEFDHLPEGVVILPERGDGEGQLDPQGWLQSVRRPVPRRLSRRVADHLAEARDLGEV